ncbi:MAG: hypothetical protein ACI9C3_001888, partial [Yoonia sp.]
MVFDDLNKAFKTTINHVLEIGKCVKESREDHLGLESQGRCDSLLYLSFISFPLNASVGVRHPRHFLGVPFKRSQIDFISRFESATIDASRGTLDLSRFRAALVLSRFSSGLFRAMFAMKEIWNGN